MQNEPCGWEVARNRETGINRLAVHHKLIVIPPNASIYAPIAEVDLILDKRGLLQIRSIRRKIECTCSRRVKLARVSDDVGELLIQKSIVRFNAHLPLVAAPVNRDCSLEIS